MTMRGSRSADGRRRRGRAEGAEVAGSDDHKAFLAKQEACMHELEGQVAEAAKTAEAVDALHGEIEQLRVQAASERVKYEPRLAGVRNAKATKAFLGDHDSNVAAPEKGAIELRRANWCTLRN